MTNHPYSLRAGLFAAMRHALYLSLLGLLVLSGCGGGGGDVGSGGSDVARGVASAFKQPKLSTTALALHVTVNGSGTVTSEPAGLTCNSDCSVMFPQDQIVTLTATPDAYQVFSGWSGSGINCPGTDVCQVNMAVARTVSATFAQAPANLHPHVNTFALGVTLVGTGSVVSQPAGIACPGTCTASYATGTVVTLTATPGTGHAFSGWSGVGCGGSGTCVMAMSEVHNVTATFTTTTATAGYPWPVWTADPVAVPVSTTGITYYVGTAGSDSNTGKTVGAPLATVKKALTLVAAGDTVLIKAGLYREGIDLSNSPSGTAAKPITFGSYGDGEVILDGSTKVNGWTQLSGTLWHAPVTVTPIAVVLNDVPLKLAPDGVATVTTGSGKWAYDASAKTITADMGGANPNTADIVVPNDVGDQQHVFFFGDYYTFKGLTIRGSGSNGIWGYGSHVTVDHCNIKFNGKAGTSFMVASGSSGSTDNAVLYSHIYHNVLLNWPRGNNGFADSGGGWAGATVWSGNLRPVARGNIVHMNGGEGVISYGTQAGAPSGSALFEQNVVYDNWSVNMYFDNQPNDVARGNIIFNHPVDTATWLRATNVYPWNEMYKFSVCLMLADEENSSDATGNYANLSGTQVYNNLIAGCRIGIRDYAEGDAHAIKYHGLKNTLIANNTIILPATPLPNTETMGIFLNDNTTPSGVNRNTNSVIQNNIVYGFGSVPLVWIENQLSLSGLTVSNNDYYNSAYATPFRIGFNAPVDMNFTTWLSQTGVDALSAFRDPLMVNALGFQATGTTPYDYANADLSASSTVRNAGKAQSTFSTNLPGATRVVWSMGAF